MDFETLEKVEATAAKGRKLADKIGSVNNIITTLSNNSIIEISFDASSTIWESSTIWVRGAAEPALVSKCPALVSKCVAAIMPVLKEYLELLEKEFSSLAACADSKEEPVDGEVCPNCGALLPTLDGSVTYKCYECNWFACGKIPCSICPERSVCYDCS